MLIPASFRLQRKRFTVYGGTAPHPVRGKTLHKHHKVWVYERGAFGGAFSSRERSETFWHELTHAILHEMKHPLWNNEPFVTDFAKLLDEAIHTAKFHRTP